MKSLVVAPSWVGDMVMAHTLVQVLHRAQSRLAVHVVAPPATVALAGRMPGVDAAHELPVGHGELGLRRRRRLALSLRGHGFEVAYVLPNSFKSALLPWWARIPRRVGWHGEARYGLLNDRRHLDPHRYPRMVDRFMSLGVSAPTASFPRAKPPYSAPSDRGYDGGRAAFPKSQAGDPLAPPDVYPKLTVDEANRARVLNKLDLNPDGPITVLCPGAEYGAAKRWPPEHFAAVARAQLQRGHSVWLLGSSEDAATARQIAEAAPGSISLAGRTSLLDAVDLLSLAAAVVTNDSGLMHIACALGRKVVALFGSTSPEFTPPLSPLATVVENDLDCRPCFQRQCPLSHLNCLRGIAPQRVVAALVQTGSGYRLDTA